MTATKPSKQQAPTTAHYGGVNALARTPSLKGFDPNLVPQGVVPATAAFPNFSYHGGPVIKCANVYTTFWGSGWSTTPAKLAASGRLNQFIKDFLASTYMNILSQYGAGKGAGAAGVFFRASYVSNVANSLSDTDIHTIIQNCINAGVIPEPSNPSNMALMIYLDDPIGVNDPGLGIEMCEPSGDNAFGYHNSFTTQKGNPFYYSVIPGLTDACLNASCGINNPGCSLQTTETQEQRRTQVSSHEFSEMVTDPELNAWYDPSNGENGDICNGEAGTITVGPNTWTVQRMYSKTDDVASNGATHCVLGEPHPLPELSPGPAAGLSPAAQLQLASPDSLTRLLPLPPVQFDASTKKMSVDPKDLREYANNVFSPLNLGAVVPDPGGFVKQFADALGAKA